MYLQITNRGRLNRKFLELIGFTTKRDRVEDVSVIGNKGSGTKLAAVAALRLGLKLAIASSDYLGRYILTFDVEEIDIDGTKARQIVLDYRTLSKPVKGSIFGKPAVTEERVRYPWAMTVDAFQDWDEPIGHDGNRTLKVLREFICNAYDEDKAFVLSRADKVGFAPEGLTTVYLLLDEDVERILGPDTAKYFKFLLKDPKKYVLSGVGEVYEKSDPASTRLFVQGVLVECTNDSWRKSLFDYSLFRKTLISEERTIKSWSDYLKELGRLLSGLADARFAKVVLERAIKGDARIEASALGTVAALANPAKAVWRQAVREHYGTDAVCTPSGNRQTDADASQIYGYVVAFDLPDGMRSFIRTLGFPDATAIAPPEPEYERIRFGDLDDESRRRFRSAFRLFATHFPERAKLPIVIFHAKDAKVREKILGYAGIGDRAFKEIWIAAKTPTTLPDELDIYETLVHEGRHVETRKGDYDREFVRVAERDATVIAYRADGRDRFPNGDAVPDAGDPDAIVPDLVDAGVLPAAEDVPDIDDLLEEIDLAIERGTRTDDE